MKQRECFYHSHRRYSVKSALIVGGSGQDGAYLAQALLERDYRVIVTSRDAQVNAFGALRRLGIRDDVRVKSLAPTDFGSVLEILAAERPDELYNLAGQSSVGLSFTQPVETVESNCIGTLNLLEAMRHYGGELRMYNACSSECFGDTGLLPADESSPFRPRSPYAVAKAAAFWLVTHYREAYGLFCCSGILFNHESPLRPDRFVTQKIVKAACRIAAGSGEQLNLGRIEIARDWGWAPEYVQAMRQMLQHPRADDFVIATGHTHQLREFVEQVFAVLGLDWREHVGTALDLHRPADIDVSRANPAKARALLGWVATITMPEVARRMVIECDQFGSG